LRPYELDLPAIKEPNSLIVEGTKFMPVLQDFGFTEEEI